MKDNLLEYSSTLVTLKWFLSAAASTRDSQSLDMGPTPVGTI